MQLILVSGKDAAAPRELKSHLKDKGPGCHNKFIWRGDKMPEKSTVEKAKEDLREGKAPTTAAGEFVREEIDHVREGMHGVRSPKQAIAIGLSKARRAGVPLPPPARGKTKEKTRKSAERDYQKGRTARAGSKRKPSMRRSRARTNALKREPRSGASHAALSKQARSAARRRRVSTGKRGGRTRSRSGRRSRRRKGAH